MPWLYICDRALEYNNNNNNNNNNIIIIIIIIQIAVLIKNTILTLSHVLLPCGVQ